MEEHFVFLFEHVHALLLALRSVRIHFLAVVAREIRPPVGKRIAPHLTFVCAPRAYLIPLLKMCFLYEFFDLHGCLITLLNTMQKYAKSTTWTTQQCVFLVFDSKFEKFGAFPLIETPNLSNFRLAHPRGG
jgi:hypothetical protein